MRETSSERIASCEAARTHKTNLQVRVSPFESRLSPHDRAPNKKKFGNTNILSLDPTLQWVTPVPASKHKSPFRLRRLQLQRFPDLHVPMRMSQERPESRRGSICGELGPASWSSALRIIGWLGYGGSQRASVQSALPSRENDTPI